MSKEKRIRTKTEVIPRIPWVGVPITSKFPEHDGPRPQLSFVLSTLSGDDCGRTKMHLSNPRPGQTLEERNITQKVLADPLSTRVAKDSMIAMMRELADLWIDSGKSGAGQNRVDNPSRRNVEYRAPAIPIPLGSSISNLFYSLIGDEVRQPQIHRDGTQSLKELVFGFTLTNCSDDEVLRGVLRHFGAKVAMYWFAKLLDSPFSRLLTRCDDCKTYFAYERAPRTDIKGGTHCQNCKKRGSAKRMESTRAKRTAEMVSFAADVWSLWKPNSRRDSSRSKWIATQVNRRSAKIRAKSGRESGSHFLTVTGRWVTQHQTEIEAEAERRNHAKG